MRSSAERLPVHRMHDAVLVTRDARAKATYELVGVAVEVV